MVTRRPRGPALVGAALALLVLLLAVAPVAAGGGPRPMQVPGGAVVAEAVLTAVQPAAVADDEPLVLTGTIRNVSAEPLVDPLATLRWSRDGLQSSEEIELVRDNPLFRYGQVDVGVGDSLPTLEPGEQAPFRLEAPLAELVPGPGVYVVGVDVLATLPDGLRVFVAAARTTVAVAIPDGDPLPAAMLWPLVASPSLLPDGRLTTDSLAAEIGPGGRLDSLARAPGTSPVTWVVDPDLLATTAAMVGGYETATPPATGSGGPDAAGFLAVLSSSLGADADVRQLPAADPDVAGMLAADLDPALVAETLTIAAQATEVSDLVGRPAPVLAVLTEDPTTRRAIRTYVDAGVGTVVLSTSDVLPAGDTAQAPVAGPDGTAPVAPLDGLGVTAVRAETIQDPSTDPTVAPEVAVRQQLLAETALQVTAQQPPSGVVLVPPLRWSTPPSVAAAALEAWQQATWLSPAPLRDLPPTTDTVRLRPDLAKPSPVDPRILAGLTAATAEVDRLAPLFAEPPLSGTERARTAARSLSTAWTDRPRQGVAYVTGLQSTIAGAADGIELVLSESITLSSRSGRFPVTLVNESTADVVVGVRFDSQNSTRLRVEPIEPIVLTAGEKRTVTAMALATANGRVVVTATMMTSEDSPVGSRASAVVDVTNVGALGWVVVGSAGVLLAAALGRSWWRRTRQPDEGPQTQPREVEDRVG
jgi:hypothetical protein